MKLSSIRPLGAQWMIKAHDYVKSYPEIVVNGFRGSEIYNTVPSTVSNNYYCCYMHMHNIVTG